MTSRNDDIPAWPVPAIAGHDPLVSCPPHVRGMSLRDWLAGQATEEDIRHWFDVFYANGISKTREECKFAYAEAMLAAREAR